MNKGTVIGLQWKPCGCLIICTLLITRVARRLAHVDISSAHFLGQGLETPNEIFPFIFVLYTFWKLKVPSNKLYFQLIWAPHQYHISKSQCNGVPRQELQPLYLIFLIFSQAGPGEREFKENWLFCWDTFSTYLPAQHLIFLYHYHGHHVLENQALWNVCTLGRLTKIGESFPRR